MPSRWMRSLVGWNVDNTDENRFWYKAIPLWFYHIMGFTLQADSCASGKSFVSTEKNGTGGAFNGSDYTFTDAAAPFAATDAAKYLIVKDTTNPVNCGIYRIKWCNSATSITIDYRAGYGEFPVAATNLSWWICGKNYQLPITTNDYVQLQSTHTSGWAIEWRNYSSPPTQHAIRIALDGNWAGNKFLSNDSTLYNRTGLERINTASVYTFWAEADIDSNWFHLWVVAGDDRGGASLSSHPNLFPRGNISLISFERVEPVTGESYEDYELWVLRGPRANYASIADYSTGHRYYDSNYALGRSWSKALNVEVAGYLIEPSPLNWGNTFCHDIPNDFCRNANYRRDAKMEAYIGSYYVVDELNYNGNFQILGKLIGHMTIPCCPTHPMESRLAITSNPRLHKMVPMNYLGSRDKLLVLDSIVIPWCGLSVVC